MNAYLENKSLAELREVATDLGIEFNANIGKTKLLEKIAADEAEVNEPKKLEGVKVKEMTVTEIKKSMDKLIRCRVSTSDPMFIARNGVTKQVGNKHKMVGKFTPFNVIWHMQEPVYNALMKQKWRQTKFKTDPATGHKVPKVTMTPSFNIEVLPPLTKTEIKKLAADQSARGSVKDIDD